MIRKFFTLVATVAILLSAFINYRVFFETLPVPEVFSENRLYHALSAVDCLLLLILTGLFWAQWLTDRRTQNALGESIEQIQAANQQLKTAAQNYSRDLK